jgi:uncharacterized protein (TIGR02246 family)
MKTILHFICFCFLVFNASAQNLNGSAADRESLDKATLAIREAFAKGDAELVAKLHHPDVVKYFGGNNVLTGRAALQKQMAVWFKTSKIEFVENTVESTVFTGGTAIQTVIFAIKSTPKNGGKATVARGRSMVVYVRDKSSPTGWLSLREMAQAAPDKK